MVGSGKRGLHHFVGELCSLDEVGHGYDLAQLEEGRVAYTLARHTNDWMMSFYLHTTCTRHQASSSSTPIAIVRGSVVCHWRWRAKRGNRTEQDPHDDPSS